MLLLLLQARTISKQNVTNHDFILMFMRVCYAKTFNFVRLCRYLLGLSLTFP